MKPPHLGEFEQVRQVATLLQPSDSFAEFVASTHRVGIHLLARDDIANRPGESGDFRFEDSAGRWSPSLSVIGRLWFDGRDVAAVLVEAAVVEQVSVSIVRRHPCSGKNSLGEPVCAFAIAGPRLVA